MPAPAPEPHPPEPRGEPRPGPALAVPPAFSGVTFGLSLAGVVAAPLVAGFGQILLSDRLGLAAGLATLLALLAAGAVAAGRRPRRRRRWGGGWASSRRRRPPWPCWPCCSAQACWPSRGWAATGLAVAGWESQGPLVVVVGLALTGLVAGTCAFAGSALGFLLFGSGRLDASMSLRAVRGQEPPPALGADAAAGCSSWW